jgi:hypothetical protein
VHENYAAVALDDGGYDRYGIAPMDEIALRANESRLAAALSRQQVSAAFRTVDVVVVAHRRSAVARVE